jgi:hypothetical protein
MQNVILLDIFHATPQSSQRLMPIAFDNQSVASVAALRETKMSSSVAKCSSCTKTMQYEQR